MSDESAQPPKRKRGRPPKIRKPPDVEEMLQKARDLVAGEAQGNAELAREALQSPDRAVETFQKLVDRMVELGRHPAFQTDLEAKAFFTNHGQHVLLRATTLIHLAMDKLSTEIESGDLKGLALVISALDRVLTRFAPIAPKEKRDVPRSAEELDRRLQEARDRLNRPALPPPDGTTQH